MIHQEFDQFGDADYQGGEAPQEEPEINITFVRDIPKVGRNDECPCGSGKKYKKCCGQ